MLKNKRDKNALFLGAALTAMSCAALAQNAPAPQVNSKAAATPMTSVSVTPLLEPLWTSQTSVTEHDESLFFIQQDAGLPTAHLLFAPLEVFSLKSATGDTTYQEGQDYIVDRQKKTVTLPPDSRIPFKTAAQIRPPKGSPHMFGEFLWSEGDFYHNLQSKITYTHAPHEWQGYVPAYAGTLLPRTIQKLRDKEPLNLVVLGDSISAGYNASGFIGAAPQMPAYPELVKNQLEQYYGAQVKLTNISVAGKTITWGLQQTAAVVAAKPDLVILAFGMNDSGELNAPTYLANTSELVKRIKADSPDAEIVLVASSLPNPDWSASRNASLLGYETGLKELSGPGVAFADMTAVWTELLKHKNYLEITGNGINHPNDFGHRLYAQTLLALLTENSAPA